MQLHGMTKESVTRVLGIADVGRLKIWMRRYNQMGDFRLTDSRGEAREYIDEYRYVKRLKLENAVLNKWLAITKPEAYQRNVGSSESSERILPFQSFAKKSAYSEVDSKLISNERI